MCLFPKKNNSTIDEAIIEKAKKNDLGCSENHYNLSSGIKDQSQLFFYKKKAFGTSRINGTEVYFINPQHCSEQELEEVSKTKTQPTGGEGVLRLCTPETKGVLKERSPLIEVLPREYEEN